MIGLEQRRRSFLLGLASMGISQLSARGMTPARGAAPEGYVLGATEGEQLIHFRDHGKIFIKVGSATGSDNLALGTQQVTVGAGIPIHRHLQMDEAFYVLEGSGIFILNDVRHRFEKDGTIFIPKNSWHGFANPDRELLLLWIMSPPGLDGFFRETCNPPGVPPKQLTREQINEIARKYGTEFRYSRLAIGTCRVSQLRGFIRVSDDSFADHPGVIGWELESKCQVRPTLRVVESFSCLTTNETEIKSMLVSPPR